MRADLPTGTVTFLFTDVEGSTKLLHELGAGGYADALAEHRRVIREAVAANGGVEVDTQGDAFLVAFPTAPGALAAAAAINEGLTPSPVRVRIGVHTGTPLVTEEGYVGADVHRAARIAAAGHGGQVLVSASARSLIDLVLRDLGEHRLKDLSAPERIFQLGDEEFPALKTLRQTNLPIPATPFLGREQELGEVVELLGRADVRLLTLTGPGGTGKTRLAAQAAGLVSDNYPDGVFWVPLARLRDPEAVLESAAQAVSASDGLAAHIVDRHLLLLFDNFEHVVRGAGGIGDVLAVCPNLDLLVTNREPLHLSGEQEYPVPPFTHDEGVSFFLARARAVKPGFELDDAVSAICRRLDELPLALELGAARVKALSPRQILERLEQRMPVLTSGVRDVPERQRTLRATMEWSYDLLTPEEQLLFRRLSVFAGGCTLDSAERVAEADLDILQSLVDKSLLRHSDERYWMLETVRQYAGDLLERSGEGEILRDHHVSFFLALVQEAEPNLTGPEQRQSYERLSLEQDNVREALTYTCDKGDGERALMLAGTIWRFWWTRGQAAEASRWYERAFAIGANASDTARARGLFGAAHMAEARGDVDQARIQFEQSATLLRRLGETRWLILALTHLSGAYVDSDPQLAERINLEALGLAEASGDLRGAAIVKGNLGGSFLVQGDDERAAAHIEEALESHRALGDVYGMASCLANLATLALRHGDLEVAEANLRESLQLSYSIRDSLTLSSTLPVAAAVALARGDPHAAARLCAADQALLRVHGFDLDVVEGQLLGDTVTAVRSALGDGLDEAWAAGADLDLDAAVDLALGALGGPGTGDRA